MCVYYLTKKKLHSGLTVTRFVCSCLSLLCAPVVPMGLCRSSLFPRRVNVLSIRPWSLSKTVETNNAMDLLWGINKSVSGCLVSQWWNNVPFFSSCGVFFLFSGSVLREWEIIVDKQLQLMMTQIVGVFGCKAVHSLERSGSFYIRSGPPRADHLVFSKASLLTVPLQDCGGSWQWLFLSFRSSRANVVWPAVDFRCQKKRAWWNKLECCALECKHVTFHRHVNSRCNVFTWLIETLCNATVFV